MTAHFICSSSHPSQSWQVTLVSSVFLIPKQEANLLEQVKWWRRLDFFSDRFTEKIDQVNLNSGKKPTEALVMMNSQIIIGPDGFCPVSNCVFSGVDRGTLNHLFCCCSKECLIDACVCCFTPWFPQAYFTSAVRWPLGLNKKGHCMVQLSLPCHACFHSLLLFFACLSPWKCVGKDHRFTGLLAFWWLSL